MHQSSLATITENGIRFSVEILHALAIRENTEVFGVYYPTPLKYGFNEKYHDIMLTAVPYYCWPFAARFRIWLNQQKAGGLSKLTSVFRQHGMSIISSEASRSGHRYATCTTTVCVESLTKEFPGQINDLKLLKEIRERVNEKVEDCIRDIEDKCENYLFSSDEALGLEMPVLGERLDALSYFYERTVISKTQNMSEVYCYPWRFTCKKGVLRPGVTTANFMKSVLADALPSRAFAEMNTRDSNIRLAVIRAKELRQFGWVSLSYTWTPTYREQEFPNDSIAPDTSSRGIASEINEVIAQDYNIWRFLDYVITMEKCIEEGNFEFFLRRNEPDNPASAWEKLKQRLESISFRHVREVKLENIHVTPISFIRIFISTRTHIGEKRGLRSICAQVGRQYGMLEEDFRMVETYTRGVIPSVVNEIRNSHAMIQYYGSMDSDPNNYDWLHAELLAAKVLNLPVVAILEEGTPREAIKTLGDHAVLRIPKEPSDEDLSLAMDKAISQIYKTRFDDI